MKTILVTGSNGFLGQKLTELLLQKNQFELIATAKGPNRYPVRTGYRYLEMDITSEEQLTKVLTEVRPDALIHTAALTNADICETAPEKCFQLNVKPVEIITSLCAKLHIHLVLLSTDFIFDGQQGPYTETAQPNPLSVYGKSKWKAEEIVRAAAIQYTILRTILVYGVIADKERSNIVLWVKNALEKGKPIQVVNDQWRMPTLAEDLASACISAVEKGVTGVFNISGNEMMTIAEIAGKVAVAWALDKGLMEEVSAESFSNAAARPRKTGFNIEKAARELDFHPHSFDAGLALVKKQLNAFKV